METMVKNGDNNGEKPVKLLEGDGSLFDRLLLRDNSMGNSSLIYYRSTTEGVPFQWERAPGTPKHEQQDEVIPPLIPPPVAQSKRLPPRPKMICVEQSKESGNKWKAWLGKKSKKKRDCINNNNNNGIHRSTSWDVSTDEFEREFMGSLQDSSSSASSASSSTTSNRDSSNLEVGFPRAPRDSRYFCTPWNITSILIRVARRV